MNIKSIISSHRTDIEFNTHNGKTQCIEVTFRGLDGVARLSLHRIVLILYSICKAQSLGKGNDRIYCPFFGKKFFLLGFRYSADNPIELLEACSSCIRGYDNILSIHLLDIPEKMYLLRKKFGVDIGDIIIRQGWGV